jgi:hypothetical protein
MLKPNPKCPNYRHARAMLDALNGILELSGQAVFQVDDCDREDVAKAFDQARAAITDAEAPEPAAAPNAQDRNS